MSSLQIAALHSSDKKYTILWFYAGLNYQLLTFKCDEYTTQMAEMWR